MIRLTLLVIGAAVAGLIASPCSAADIGVAPMPDTMLAVAFDKGGGPDVLAIHHLPVPKLNAGLRIPDYPQSSPVNWKLDPKNLLMGQFGFRSHHSGGVYFLFGDGSVKFLQDSIDVTKVYRPLSTRDSNEVVQLAGF